MYITYITNKEVVLTEISQTHYQSDKEKNMADVKTRRNSTQALWQAPS